VNFGDIWNLILMQPMINVLIVLSHVLFSNLGLAIIALTVLIRAAMYPLTAKQMRSTMAMQKIQPQMAELQKKYGRDKNRMAQEQMKLYKEAGFSPLGCVVPMLIQFPIWIALYQSIIILLGTTPENFLDLSKNLYSWDFVYSALPVSSYFLGLNLGEPNMGLAFIVGISMWLQQKQVQPPVMDPAQKQQSQMMLYMMPLLFAWMSMSFASGLAMYWVVSNVISILLQYFIAGRNWGGLRFNFRRNTPAGGVPKNNKSTASSSSMEDGKADNTVSDKEGKDDGKSGDKRENSRGGNTPSPRKIRRNPR